MVRAVSNEALTVEDTDDNERMCHVMVCSRRQIFQISRSFGRVRALLGIEGGDEACATKGIPLQGRSAW